jgi:hypothetical protein
MRAARMRHQIDALPQVEFTGNLRQLPRNVEGIICDKCGKGVKSVGIVCGQALCAPCEAKITGRNY